ncbi:MAG TPA: molybdate ABC transporter substrate-binding protein [Terriglobales bacterium]|nr:molybdate ABC transporter substrate-binding protein [Terriglobales bacterium]
MRKGILLLVLLAAVGVAAQEMTVAAASDLNYALKDIASSFETRTGKKIRLSFGSSGNLSVAIRNGAPYDVFFSADAEYAKGLVDAGLVLPGTFYTYAEGAIVLWVPKASKLDLKQGLAVLSDPAIRKIAIANPRHAPYGRAAVAALRSANLYDKVSSKFVLGENIAQTAQFVQTGNADAGIVALSLALSPGMSAAGRYYVIPRDSYPRIEQAAVILKSAKDKAVAREFMEFIKSPAATEIMKRYGFRQPTAKGTGG